MRSGKFKTLVLVVGIFGLLGLVVGLFLVAPTIQAREPAEKEWRQYEQENFPPPPFKAFSEKGYMTAEEIEKNNMEFEQLKPAKKRARTVIFSKHINAHRLSNVPVFLVLCAGLGWLTWKLGRNSNG